MGPFLTATFSGAPEILDAIDEALADFFASARDDLQPILDDVDSTSLPEALVALYGHHLLEGFSAQLAPRRGESLLTYEVELSDRGWLSLVALAQLASPFMDQLRGTPGSRSFDLDEEFALIAVASQHIPAGSTIDPSMIEAAEIPYYELPYDPVFWFDLEYYLDLPLQNDVEAGQILRESDFAIPEDHELNYEAWIPEELRAPADVAAPPEDAEFTDSGLASKVLQVGHGQEHPSANSIITVNFIGWTSDGELFDDSDGGPIVFPLPQMIPGWIEGIQLMVAGETRRFWIPAHLAEGSLRGWPTGKMLVFDVMLVGFSNRD